MQKALNWNNPVQAQDAISFSKVYCFRRYPTPLITKQNENNTIKAGGSTTRAQNVGLDGVERVGDTP